MNNKIILKKINQNNFQNVSLEIEKNQFIVITGPSGSGKSTLVNDIIYAEGQRKFIESLPLYARQFIPLPEKPNIEDAIGLTPCVMIDQKTSSSNNRSTVGTVSEIYDYLRILYATVGEQYCLNCKTKIHPRNANQLSEFLIKNHNNNNIEITFNINKNKNKKENIIKDKEDIINKFIFSGITNFNINDKNIFLRSTKDIENIKLKKNDIINAVLYKQNNNHQRDILINSIKLAYLYNDIISINIDNKLYYFSYKNTCTTCNNAIEYQTINQKIFSFNLPTGACENCKGTAESSQLEKILASLNNDSYYDDIPTNHSINKICNSCNGARLNSRALSIIINGKNIYDFCQIPLIHCEQYINKIIEIYFEKKEIIDKICAQIIKRISLLIDLGLGYLTLSRNTNSLSGGELQRIRLSGQLGSALTGVTYILDEPSIGLHQRDNTKLIKTIKKLRDIGNTVIVVEHDDETMLSADHIIDIGPGAGIHGGKIIFSGKPKDIIHEKKSITGKYLSNTLSLKRINPLNTGSTFFTIKNATKNNLKNITLTMPIGGLLIVVSGVSGSGKSTLIFEEFIPQFQEYINIIKEYNFEAYKNNKKIETAPFDAIITVNQQSIGRTCRSTIGTYFKFFDEIRELFSLIPESKAQGLKKGDFSFNTGSYRCKNCSGKGYILIEMDPLPSTTIHCIECDGQRYSNVILKITYNNKNIFEILEMTIENAAKFFINHKKINRPLQALIDVGLGYITLNQSSDTFSGGESQRVKLAYELNRRNKNTIYVLDEPTTGLHFQDISLLLNIFDKLIKKGNTIIVIEHNLSVIRYADFIIDVGPEGGENGGNIIAAGTPDEIKKNKSSITGTYI